MSWDMSASFTLFSSFADDILYCFYSLFLFVLTFKKFQSYGAL